MGNGENPAKEESSFPASLAPFAPGHVLDGLRDMGPMLSSEADVMPGAFSRSMTSRKWGSVRHSPQACFQRE